MVLFLKLNLYKGFSNSMNKSYQSIIIVNKEKNFYGVFYYTFLVVIALSYLLISCQSFYQNCTQLKTKYLKVCFNIKTHKQATKTNF